MKFRKSIMATFSIFILVALMGALQPAAITAEDAEARIAQIVSQMTLDEKVEQMAGDIGKRKMVSSFFSMSRIDFWTAPGNKKFGVPQILCSDGPRGMATGNPGHIPSLQGLKGTTCFPVAMARASSWDVDLENRVGAAIGYEIRAMGGNMALTPCINTVTHPGWGRTQETYGEDTYLLGMMGVAQVRGLQNHVMACPKHFAANNLEESRMFVNAQMSERTLREVYLPHFKVCVDAGAASIMSAYNDLNGYLCGHNKHLLRDILKGEWGFKGFVVSDWFSAVEDDVAAANAGLDLEMPYGRRYNSLKRNVLNGKVPVAYIDDSVTRILREKFRFDGEKFQTGYEKNKIAGSEHATLALEAEAKGIVLLKNENSTLPLDIGDDLKLLVIGKMAKEENIGDLGSSSVKPPYVVTPMAGIQNKCTKRTILIYDDGELPDNSAKAAKIADVVVIVVGMTYMDEGEYIAAIPFVKGKGGDREDLRLHPKDEELIKKVCEANKKCVVILEGGSAIVMQSWKKSAAAILMAWYPGMEGGNAIADVLFGNTNPSGKLPVSWPASNEQLPKLDNKSKNVAYDYYHGYRYFDKKNIVPDFPFGFGLSYTQFKYSNLKVGAETIAKDGKIEVSFDLTNTGKIAGDEIAQLYIGCVGSKVDRAVKELKGFARVSLAAGETKTVKLEVAAKDLAYYNEAAGVWEVESIEYNIFAGSSSADNDLTLRGKFRIQ